MALFKSSYKNLKLKSGVIKMPSRCENEALKRSTLTLADQLVLTFLYLRQYHTFLQLGDMFGISESYASKRYHFINKTLIKALDLPKDKDLILEKISLVADVTEQEIERPVCEQKTYYSGKKSDIP